MKMFAPYPDVNNITGETLWYFLDEHGSTVGPYESEESAGGAANSARKTWRHSQENEPGM